MGVGACGITKFSGTGETAGSTTTVGGRGASDGLALVEPCCCRGGGIDRFISSITEPATICQRRSVILRLLYLREDLLEREVVDVFELSTGELSDEPAEPSSSSSSATDSVKACQRKSVQN